MKKQILVIGEEVDAKEGKAERMAVIVILTIMVCLLLPFFVRWTDKLDKQMDVSLKIQTCILQDMEKTK